MNRYLRCPLSVAVVFVVATPARAAKCHDIPLRVTLYTNAVVDPAQRNFARFLAEMV